MKYKPWMLVETRSSKIPMKLVRGAKEMICPCSPDSINSTIETVALKTN